MSTRAPISVLIPVKNERSNLPDCLASCRFADDVVVVDSASTDGSADLAAQAGARVIDFKWDGRFPKKKNWALANVAWRHDWIFILDADERIPTALADELEAIARNPPAELAGYYVNRRFWFLDGWLNHCGYYPSWNLRFFRHAAGRYEESAGLDDSNSGDNEVHEHVVLQGRAGRLRHEMEHHAFPSLAVWVEKHNRYSSWEARLINAPGAAEQFAATAGALDPALARRRRIKHLARRLPFRPAARFLYHYVVRAGFLDGYRGYVFCRLMAFYEFLSVAKAREARRRPAP